MPLKKSQKLEAQEEQQQPSSTVQRELPGYRNVREWEKFAVHAQYGIIADKNARSIRYIAFLKQFNTESLNLIKQSPDYCQRVIGYVHGRIWRAKNFQIFPPVKWSMEIKTYEKKELMIGMISPALKKLNV